MERQIYVSASRMLKEKIRKQKVTKYRIIYTDDIENADYILIQQQDDGTLENEQFRDLVKARELGVKVDYVKEGPEKEKLQQMKDTRKKFDLEIE